MLCHFMFIIIFRPSDMATSKSIPYLNYDKNIVTVTIATSLLFTAHLAIWPHYAPHTKAISCTFRSYRWNNCYDKGVKSPTRWAAEAKVHNFCSFKPSTPSSPEHQSLRARALEIGWSRLRGLKIAKYCALCLWRPSSRTFSSNLFY